MKKLDWQGVKDAWFLKNLEPHRTEFYTLKMLADKFGIPYGTVRNKAAEEGWKQELEERVVSRSKNVLAVAEREHTYSEYETRMRQASIARLLLEKVMCKLDSVLPSELSIRECIDILKVALVEERKALGLPDRYVQEVPQSVGPDSYETVEDNARRLEKLRLVGDRLASILEGVPEDEGVEGAGDGGKG